MKGQPPAGEWRSAKLRFPRHQAGRAGVRRGRKMISCPRNTGGGWTGTCLREARAGLQLEGGSP